MKENQYWSLEKTKTKREGRGKRSENYSLYMCVWKFCVDTASAPSSRRFGSRKEKCQNSGMEKQEEMKAEEERVRTSGALAEGFAEDKGPDRMQCSLLAHTCARRR
jgi:hypothetical protein